jgi:uncharacterized protein (DUF433 family)
MRILGKNETEAYEGDISRKQVSDLLRRWRHNAPDTEYRQRNVHHIVALNRPVTQRAVNERCRALAERLCDEHTNIETNANIKGGIPRIKGSRIAVGQVLGRIYALESIDAVAAYYAPEISKEQIKEAVAFAKDFLETACEPL